MQTEARPDKYHSVALIVVSRVSDAALLVSNPPPVLRSCGDSSAPSAQKVESLRRASACQRAVPLVAILLVRVFISSSQAAGDQKRQGRKMTGATDVTDRLDTQNDVQRRGRPSGHLIRRQFGPPIPKAGMLGAPPVAPEPGWICFSHIRSASPRVASKDKPETALHMLSPRVLA